MKFINTFRNDINWASPTFNDQHCEQLDSTQLVSTRVDEIGLFEGWFRVRLRYIYTTIKEKSGMR